MAPSSPSNGQSARKLFDVVVTESNAREVRDAVKLLLDNQTGSSEASRYLPNNSDLGALVREMRRAAGVSSGRQPEVDSECQVPEDYIPIETPMNDEQVSSSNDARPELRWMQTPTNDSGRQAMKAMAREAFPNGTASQDGLNFFCRNAETQKIFQGQQLDAGAALSLPKEQQQTLLASLAVKMPSPEAAKALSLIQTLLPAFLGEVEPGALRDIVQNWAQKNLSSTIDLPRFFESCLEIFQHTGLGSMEGVQELLVFLVKESGAEGAVNGMEESLDQLSQNLSTMRASGLPHLNGLNEFLGGGLRQSLGQILQPLMRILSGLFFMKADYQWPKALPNEKALAELATLFAYQSQKSNGRKNKRNRKRKGLKSVFGMMDPRVETELDLIEDANEKIQDLAS